jgi:hypothetical protein
MTIQEMTRAGGLCDNINFSDEELRTAIKGTELALAYLEARGLDWSLAIRPLRVQLMQLEGFAEARKLNRKS